MLPAPFLYVRTGGVSSIKATNDNKYLDSNATYQTLARSLSTAMSFALRIGPTKSYSFFTRHPHGFRNMSRGHNQIINKNKK
jgi:hypothetical protein